ncbi:MAG: tetratricopeptide repeat protein, partial [Cyanobacteria bacterium J06621_12]
MPYISRQQTEDLLNCFATAIKQPKSQPLVFNVWGIGGVGKTTLLNRIEKQPEISAARVYFGATSDIATPLKLMANLYSQLPATNDWGSEFEAFPELYAKYEETLAKLKQPDKKETDTQGTARKEALKKLVGGSAKTLVQVTPLKGVAGVEDKIGSIAEGGVDLVDWLQKQRATKKDRELQSLMLKPIPKLTGAFIRGIIAKSQHQPVVLLFDTYEKTNSAIDNWLWQYLIANSDLKSHRVRVVVAGRKNLLKQESWRKLQQDLNLVYSLEINRFDEAQTAEYLTDISIDSSAEIYQVTKGLPYYLNWIREQKAKGKELDFSVGNQAIVDLLLQGLNPTQKKIIQLAACCRYFNKSLIQHLVTSQQLDFAVAADPELNCFEWLIKLDFVEFAQNTYRLDDVARDVFRLSLWQANEGEEFRQINDAIANYYGDRATREIASNTSPPRIYENQEWQQYTAESLYHCLYARQADWESKFLNHLLASCYLRETEVVTTPVNAIVAEVNIEDNILLSSSVKKCLQNIKPIFEFDCLSFEAQTITSILKVRILDSANQNLSLEQLQATHKVSVDYCLNRLNSLIGLAKFAGLLYKAKHCSPTMQLEYLQKAKSQAEEIIIDSDPEFSSGLFSWDLGNALFNLGRYEDAIAAYDQALAIKPELHEAWYNRGIALFSLGRYEDAIAAYDQALAIKPDDPEAWNNRGNALANLERYEDAIASFDKALAIKPDDHKAWYNRGIALFNLERYEDAIADYDQALAIKPDLHEALYNRGVALDDLERYEGAIADYDQALAIKPDKDEAWNNRGTALANLEKYEDAIAAYDQALAIKPDKDEAWNNRGNALANLERYED